MPIDIDFEWKRDKVGYGAQPRPDRRRMAVGTEWPTDERIYPQSGNLVTYRPFNNTGGRLHQIFASQAETKEGLLQFTNRFGPLTGMANQAIGEPVEIGLRHASQMNQWLAASPEDRAASLAQLGDEGLYLTEIGVALLSDPITGKLQLRYQPKDLVNALWLELASGLTGDTKIRRCAHCGSWFEVGPGTGRRDDAKYCSRIHQIKFNSSKRPKGRATHA